MDTFIARMNTTQPPSSMRIALFGPPGAGKGTQASLLEKEYGLRSISTGNLIRGAIRNETTLGRIADAYVSAGDLVPDELVRDLANEAVADLGFRNFILDGYPRTLQQAAWLMSFLSAHAAPLVAVLSIDVPDEQIVERLSRRRIHAETGESYHLDLRPPPADIDPSLIVRRSDDEPDRIRRRLETYRRDTKPLETYFRDKGVLVEIPGTGSVDDVRLRINRALATRSQPEPAH